MSRRGIGFRIHYDYQCIFQTQSFARLTVFSLARPCVDHIYRQLPKFGTIVNQCILQKEV